MEAVMIDQTHTKTVSTQTAPVVCAALITTCGVILAAFIQSGYFGRPAPTTVALSQPTITGAQASFLGTIEAPVEPQQFEVPHQAGATVDFKPISSPPGIEPVAAFLPAMNTPARLPGAESTGADSPKTFASPWTYLTNPPPQPPHADAAKPVKKPGDWSALTRIFKGHD
jgi:hypothetical protein